MTRKLNFRFLFLFVAASALFLAVPPFLKVHADDVPLAARLLSVPYDDTDIGGLRATVTGPSLSVRGISNDGTTVYLLHDNGDIVSVPMSLLVGLPGGTVSVAGTLHSVGWGTGGAPSFGEPNGRSIAYSHGCLFINDDNASGTPDPISLYCIDISDWSVTQITIPDGKPLPAGHSWGRGTMIDFSDGRIGKVSAYASDGEGGYLSYIRMYTVSGSGKSATIAWSHDYYTHDTRNFNTDEHGVATDGTYLYRIEFQPAGIPEDFQSWPLEADGTPNPVFSGFYTIPPGYNVTFLSHDHINSRYMFGAYGSNQFYITSGADPGPGPGHPLTPAFGSVTSTADGFTVQVTNYDADFTWDTESTSGSAFINGTGLVTVTELDSGESSTVTVSTSLTGIPDGSADIEGTALVGEEDEDDPPPPPTSRGSRVVGGSIHSASLVTAVPIVVVQIPYFIPTLKYGMTGGQIHDLQAFLNNHGFILATSGGGSPGSETDKFLVLTKNALMAFQLAHPPLQVDGIMGPKTAAALNAIVEAMSH